MDSFDHFVRSRGAALLRFAYLLCGDAHRAEDFTQEALVRCHRRWRAIERGGQPEPYVRRAILRQFLSWRRRRSATERPADSFEATVDVTDAAQELADRDEMWHTLATLPRKQRAVLVLRYYEDLPDSRIADLLNCSAATVRVHAGRALARLRRHPRFTDAAVDVKERL